LPTAAPAQVPGEAEGKAKGEAERRICAAGRKPDVHNLTLVSVPLTIYFHGSKSFMS
jgi:hypothetical protein